MNRFEPYHPTYEELDAAIAHARAMRARAMRDGFVAFGAMLRRVMKPRPAGLLELNRGVAKV